MLPRFLQTRSNLISAYNQDFWGRKRQSWSLMNLTHFVCVKIQ